jgi:hypothetical protein
VRKTCGKCKKHRNLTSFVKDAKRQDGLYPYCRDCQRQYASQWYQTNRDRELEKNRKRQRTPQARRQKRESHLQKCYGITVVEYETRRRRQRGLCLICRRYFGRKLVVDHDHRTGRVRGLLCIGCNSDIRLFERGTRMVNRIVKYLAA